MKILITGETGFIGQRVAKRLRADGHQLVSMGRRGQIVADFSGEFDVPDLSEFEMVLHLAGHAHAPDSTENQRLHEAVNRRATERLVLAARDSGVKRILFLSSIAVYGEPTSPEEEAHVWSEDGVLQPKTPYGESKRQGELAVANGVRNSPSSFIILRLPMVYGPRAPGNFSLLLKLVRMGLPLPVGRFANRRSFLYVENLVDAISLLVADTSVQNEVFNISDEDVVSTAMFATWMGEGLRKSVRIWNTAPSVLKPFVMMAGQRERFQKLVGTCEINSSKLRSVLRWTPRFSTRQGVLKSIADLENYE